MSTTYCKETGIATGVTDSSDMLFVLNHPLARYAMVKSTFEYKTHAIVAHEPLLAGSIITILKHHKLFKVHGQDEALAANIALCEQSRGVSQLLALVHKLINNEKKLATYGKGIPVANNPDGDNIIHYQFSLESAASMGNEHLNENHKFLASLQDWIGEMLPPSESELLALAEQAAINKPLFDMDVELLEMSDGSQVSYSKVLDAVKNQIEDNTARQSRRMGRVKVIRKSKDQVRLATEYGVFNNIQRLKLVAMLNDEKFNPVMLTKALEMLKGAAGKESDTTKQRKLFEIAAWLRAADTDFADQAAFDEAALDTGLDALQVVVDSIEADAAKPKETLKERIARLKK